jgi:nicotinamide-nucleotide amidase
MLAEIITIGDEILIGQTVDTNSAWMGHALNEVGVEVARITSVADREEAIVHALDHVLPGTTMVLITGGLGPTKDDLTKIVLTRYFHTELAFHPLAYENLARLFAQLGREVSEINRLQAMLPVGARIYLNKLGTASGMHFEHHGIHFISMPGVPYEMKHLMEDYVIPFVQRELETSPILHRTLLTTGAPESVLAERLDAFENQLPPDIKLAYLPSPGLVKLRLTARGRRTDLEAQLEERFAELSHLLADVAFGSEAQSLEEIIGKMLLELGHTLGTVESCTGGAIARTITAIPGSSAYFRGGIIPYHGDLKQQLLQVPKAVMMEQGQVSEPVAIQLAREGQRVLGTDWCISTTGIAGPTGATPEKPVGTVWIGIAGPGFAEARKFQFGNERGRNIQKTTLTALDILRKKLKKSHPQTLA